MFINGVQNKLPPRSHLQFSYIVTLKRSLPGNRIYDLFEKFDITDPLRNGPYENSILVSAASDEAVARLKTHPEVAKVEPIRQDPGVDGNIFPRDPNYKWNIDHYGKLWIPKAGETIQSTLICYLFRIYLKCLLKPKCLILFLY